MLIKLWFGWDKLWGLREENTQLHPRTLRIPPEFMNTVTTGDARELARALPAESVDCIFTDPPYPEAFLPLYGWVAELGAMVLKPGGFLCAMTGGYHLDKVFAQMSGKGLDWYFSVVYLCEGDSPVIWPRQMIANSKEILLWTKGPGLIKYWNMPQVYKGQGKDKRYHAWGQEVGVARYCLEYILGTDADAIVLDPFAGGGSTLEAARLLGYDYIGFEIDPGAAEIARQRLADTPVLSAAPLLDWAEQNGNR